MRSGFAPVRERRRREAGCDRKPENHRGARNGEIFRFRAENRDHSASRQRSVAVFDKQPVILSAMFVMFF